MRATVPSLNHIRNSTSTELFVNERRFKDVLEMARKGKETIETDVCPIAEIQTCLTLPLLRIRMQKL